MAKVIKKSKTLKDILRLSAWVEYFLDQEIQTISHGQAIDDNSFLVLFETMQLIRKAQKKLSVYNVLKEGMQ